MVIYVKKYENTAAILGLGKENLEEEVDRRNNDFTLSLIKKQIMHSCAFQNGLKQQEGYTTQWTTTSS